MPSLVEDDTILEHAARLKDLKDLIAGLCCLWKPRLNLHHWRVLEFHYELGNAPDSDTHDVYAFATSQWEYLTADISFYLEAMLDLSGEEIEYVVVHEMCHLMVCEMRPVGVDQTVEQTAHEERVVSNLARAFIQTAEDADSKTI